MLKSIQVRSEYCN